MRWSLLRGMVVSAVAALGLTACGGGTTGIFGGGGSQAPTPVEQQTGAGATLRNMFLYSGPTVPPSQPPNFNQDQDEMSCPGLDILENKAAIVAAARRSRPPASPSRRRSPTWRANASFRAGSSG